MGEWATALEKSNKYFTDGSKGVQNFTHDLEKFEFAVKNADGAYTITESGKDIEAVAKQFGVSTSAIIQMFDKLKDYGWEIDYDFNLGELEEPKTALEQLNEEIDKLNKKKAELEIDTGTSSEEVSAIQAKIDELTTKKHTIELVLNDGSENPVIKEIQEIQKVLDDPKTTGFLKASLQSRQAKLAKDNNIDLEVALAVNIDNVDKAMQDSQQKADDSPVKLTANADDIKNKALEKFKETQSWFDTNSLKVSFKVDTTELDRAKKLANGGVPVTAPQTGGSEANGGVSAGGETLAGELGPELVVDRKTGTYYTVGNNGPEFVDLGKGDIVFNHDQTDDLLNRGHTGTKGKALADGNFRTKFGNIDLEHRAGIYDEQGRIQTVLGSWGQFGPDELPIAYSPILQIGDGTGKILDDDTAFEYVAAVLDEIIADGLQATKDQILAYDHRGIIWDDGTFIHDLIAEVGSEAERVSHEMHEIEAQRYGPSSANGGGAKGGRTLMGELGPELVVDRKTGTYYTVGANGPEFVDLNPGDIVFDHNQTVDLLKRGYT